MLIRKVPVIASVAKQSSVALRRDCFAALAMTGTGAFRRIVTLLVLLPCITSVPVLASYRVHQLRVNYNNGKSGGKRSVTVLSILDHVQYQTYNGGYNIVKVQLLDHWYCPGDTSRKQYCKKPKIKQGILVEDNTRRSAIK